MPFFKVTLHLFFWNSENPEKMQASEKRLQWVSRGEDTMSYQAHSMTPAKLSMLTSRSHPKHEWANPLAQCKSQVPETLLGRNRTEQWWISRTNSWPLFLCLDPLMWCHTCARWLQMCVFYNNNHPFLAASCLASWSKWIDYYSNEFWSLVTEILFTIKWEAEKRWRQQETTSMEMTGLLCSPPLWPLILANLHSSPRHPCRPANTQQLLCRWALWLEASHRERLVVDDQWPRLRSFSEAAGGTQDDWKATSVSCCWWVRQTFQREAYELTLKACWTIQVMNNQIYLSWLIGLVAPFFKWSLIECMISFKPLPDCWSHKLTTTKRESPGSFDLLPSFPNITTNTTIPSRCFYAASES